MKFKVAFQELPPILVLPGFDQPIHQTSQMIHVGFGDKWASPLQSKRFQLDSQGIELANFIRVKRSDESPFVFNTPYEPFMLKRDERLAHGGGPNVHLLCDLAFHDRGARPQSTGEEGVL